MHYSLLRICQIYVLVASLLREKDIWGKNIKEVDGEKKTSVLRYFFTTVIDKSGCSFLFNVILLCSFNKSMLSLVGLS